MAKNLMIRYVFETNPNGLRKIITKYGIAPAKNPNDLWKKTNYIVMKFPQDALRDIVSIHPDRGIILKLSGLEKSNRDEKHITAESPISKEAIEKLQSANVTPKVEVTPIAEKKASACGCGCGGDKTSGCDGGSCSCGGKCGGKKSNADGDTKEKSSAPAVVVHTAPHIESKGGLKEHLPLIMIGVVAVAGFWLLSKNKTLPNLMK